MNGQLPRGAGQARTLARGRTRSAARALGWVALTLGTAAALSMIVYLVSTTVPYLATSPTTDPVFGEHNQCLLEGLGEPRVGFAVSPDGRAVAGYGGTTLAICARPVRSGGEVAGPAALRRLEVAGITAAAFDFDSSLWLATGKGPGSSPGLWRLEPEGALVRAGDFTAIALVGHARGAAALDASGRLMSLAAGGEVRGVAQLDPAAMPGAQLAVNADGSRLSVVAGAGLVIYRAPDLKRLSAEGFCDSEFLWWRPEPQRALLACGPRASWSLEVDVVTGQADPAPRRSRAPSTLVGSTGGYVHPCDQLPCSAPPP